MIVLVNQLGGLVRGQVRVVRFFIIAALGGRLCRVFGIWARANEEPTEYHRGGRPDR